MEAVELSAGLGRWATVAAVVMTVLVIAGCAPSPPAGSISEAQAKTAAIEWVSEQDHLEAWDETVRDPNTPVTVTYLPDNPTVDDAAITHIWSVEFTSPRVPADPKEPVSSITVQLRMNGSFAGFEANNAP